MKTLRLILASATLFLTATVSAQLLDKLDGFSAGLSFNSNSYALRSFSEYQKYDASATIGFTFDVGYQISEKFKVTAGIEGVGLKYFALHNFNKLYPNGNVHLVSSEVKGSFINFPLAVKYYFYEIAGIEINASVGANLAARVGNTQVSTYSDLTTRETDFLRKGFYGVQLGAGAEYEVYDKIKVMIEPAYRLNFSEYATFLSNSSSAFQFRIGAIYTF